VNGLLLRLRQRMGGDDRGSGAAAVVIFASLFMVLAAFVIDGGLSISQRERAADIAEQAARYAAEDIDQAALRKNGTVAINYADCGERVREFAQQSGLSGPDVAASGCVDAAADHVRVEIRLTYHPVLMGLFYDAPLEVHGTAEAVPLTG
jgi:hypothetical protein